MKKLKIRVEVESRKATQGQGEAWERFWSSFAAQVVTGMTAGIEDGAKRLDEGAKQ